MTKKAYDLVVIGAGPAGMAAAITASENDLSVLVLDEQMSAGGQVYRNLEKIESTRKSDFQKLGDEYSQASDLIRQFKKCSAEYLPFSTVWQIEEGWNIRVIQKNPEDGSEATRLFQAKRIIVATGAMERPMPIQGWTLPGVMACTAADVLFKSSGLIPSGKVVLAGSGPLLLLVANRLLDANVQISALLDTSSKQNLKNALQHLPSALKSHELLLKGAKMQLRVRLSKIPIYSNIDHIEAEGQEQLNLVRFRSNGHWHTTETDLLLLHQGVVPNIQITRQLGCEHRWYDVQRYWEPIVDEWGNTTVEGIMIAGDCGRVSGAGVSEISGRIAAFETARALGKISTEHRNSISSEFRSNLDKQKASRPFLDHLFQPQKNWIVPADDDTMVCRCEEVTARNIRDVVKLGIHQPDRVKALTRCGMGPCQGRMCGLTVSEIIADEMNQSPANVGYYRLRSPIKPITLEQLAGCD